MSEVVTTTPPRRLRSHLARAVLVAGSSLLALAGLEAIARHLDGYPVLVLRLPPGFPPASIKLTQPSRSLAVEAAKLQNDIQSDPEWIDMAPPPLANRQPVAPEFLERRRRAINPGIDEFDLYHIWNRRVAEERGCSTLPQLSHLPMPLDVFEPLEPGMSPPFRYYPGRTTPLGLTTNAFGFRGPEISLNKPAGTVRIAFVGASTTVGSYGAPFSYPEYVVHWLNLWAERMRSRVRFDLVNAGRTGMTSENIAAIVRQEVLPLEPDLLVYYEGSNQFIFADNLAGEEFPVLGRPESFWEAVLRRTGSYSALVGRVARGVRSLEGEAPEPPKPRYTLHWPQGLDREKPELARTDLPLDLSQIVSDLHSIRDSAGARGAELAVASFVIFVEDGLRISQGFLYDWLNHRCWPYTYADLRMLADFQNTVFERFAAQEQLLFVDVARRYPMNPQWFFDAIHFTDDGTRLQAWVVLQSILPRIRDRIATGAWPAADREAAKVHPHLHGSSQLVLPCAR